jgi:hypothetical protein
VASVLPLRSASLLLVITLPFTTQPVLMQPPQ